MRTRLNRSARHLARAGALLLTLFVPVAGAGQGQSPGSGLPRAMAAPDLHVTAVDRSGVAYSCPDAAASGTVTATIRNGGDDATGAGFWVQFFEDSNLNGSYDPGVDLSLGEAEVPASLAAGDEAPATLVFGSPVAFSGNLIHALADSHEEIAESNESNNVLNSGATCAFQPGPGNFNPVLEWAWTASNVEEAALNVLMTPAVADLNGDAIPDIVFGSTASVGGGYIEVGVLRALSGSTGAELFTVTDPNLAIDVASAVAVGDLDGDGLPEILAADATANHLLCFEHDGTYKWTSDETELINWGAPAIADLNQDGAPEIILGRQAFDSGGALLWTGAGSRGLIVPDSPLSYAADVDQDGSPDVVAGNTVYAADGSTLYENLDLTDGTTAVANFDADPQAEIVLVGESVVWLLDHDCSVKWGPIAHPGGGGGPPTIADFDGDGLPEIGVAGTAAYTVFEDDGTIKWSSTTQDFSSYVTGSSVFDFDGDGSAEVVYRDELYLRVYQGSDGTVLYEVPMSSCTWHEYVLVADVDADGNAEIVAVANQNCGRGPEQGIYVLGDASDSWVGTRRIWNEYAYHITNVSDDGTIPAVEETNWLSPPAQPYNSFRQNTLPGGAPLAAANLTASLVGVDLSSCPSEIGLTARIGNGGSNVAVAPVRVALRSGATLLGVASTSIALLPGRYEDVTLWIPASLQGTVTLCATADDDGSGFGAISECDESDNLCCADVVIEGCDPADVTPGGAPALPGVAAWPNPARRSITLRFDLPVAGPVAVSITDAAGRIVRSYQESSAPAGQQTLQWDLRNENGAPAPAGVYAYRITSGTMRIGGRLIVIP